MSAEAIPLQFVPTLAPEEAARADLYGLLARLFYAAPDAALLASIASSARSADAGAGKLGQAWRELAQAAEGADPETVREEHETVFIGTGKAAVTLYMTAYTIRYASESPLADLREDLARHGLARLGNAHEPEDHIAGLCEVMRWLISEQRADLAAQKAFFECWIWPGAAALCNAINHSPSTGFYRAVANIAERFFEVEHSAFEML